MEANVIPPQLLIVEDDDQFAALLMEYLGTQDFVLDRVATGEEGVRRILQWQPDLVLLDLMLPGGNGLDVCRRVRTDYRGVILMLTASQNESDHVAGLELGADDFVVKPIEPRVLLARVRAQLRRSGKALSNPCEVGGILEVGMLRVDVRLRDVSVAGATVVLTSMEFDILVRLVREAGTIVSREDLYREIMGIAYDGLDRGMDVHVSRIRGKLSKANYDASRLKSVRGVGYLLAAR